ncbi:metallophosphoesterase [Acidaminococcus sp.]|uniref:metallophosphoesterase n=1 Tax=Acidaminococcus sp. TaxID=1872103 RepID=UPI003D7EB17E
MEKNEQMRIGVVSDTHGDLHALHQVLDQAGEVDLWLHAGDYSQDAPYIEEETGIPVYAVCGNCDSYTDRAPAELVTKQLGFTLAMTHGHRYVRYNDWSRLFYFGEEKHADVVIFGHIHVPVCMEEEGILLVNPGSPSRPRNGVPSFGILTLEKGKKPKFEVVEVKE